VCRVEGKEMAAMKNVLIGLVVLIIVVCGLAYWRGWFEPEKQDKGGETHLGVKVNKDKFKQDKEKFKQEFKVGMKAVQDRLAHLRGKHKDATGDDKAKAEKEIEELTKKHDALDAKAKEIEEATEEKFDALKQDVTKALEEAKKEKENPK
jgi:hypothetical protein